MANGSMVLRVIGASLRRQDRAAVVLAGQAAQELHDQPGFLFREALAKLDLAHLAHGVVDLRHAAVVEVGGGDRDVAQAGNSENEEVVIRACVQETAEVDLADVAAPGQCLRNRPTFWNWSPAPMRPW